MLYDNCAQLPKSVKDNLPKHAQDIYKEAFNSVWDTYKQAKDRHSDDDRETVAHKVAWSAVKNSCKKETHNNNWVKIK